MKIKVELFSYRPLNIVSSMLKNRAKHRVSKYTFGDAEYRLNNYFYANYNCGLREMCKRLINYSRVIIDSEKQNYIILFKDEIDDSIASLISYGNLGLPKSNILKFAFMY